MHHTNLVEKIVLEPPFRPSLESFAGRIAENGPSESQLVPVWRPVLREVWLAKRMIKRFMRPAPILEKILTRFQELNWPALIDDPLPPQIGIDPRQRLHDAIKRLNRCQKPQFIRFFGDGTGKRICWELVEPNDDRP